MKHKLKASAFNTAPLLNYYLWSQMESKEKRWAPFLLKPHHAQLFWSVRQLKLLLNEKHFLHVQVRVRLIRGQKDILMEVWETKPPQKQGCCSNVKRENHQEKSKHTNSINDDKQTFRLEGQRERDEDIRWDWDCPTTTSLPAVSSIFDPTWRWRTDGGQHSSQLLLTVCVRRGENKLLTEYWEVKV